MGRLRNPKKENCPTCGHLSKTCHNTRPDEKGNVTYSFLCPRCLEQWSTDYKEDTHARK